MTKLCGVSHFILKSVQEQFFMEIHVKFYSLVRHFGYCSSQACSLLVQFIKYSSLTKIDIFRLSKGKFNMKRSLFIFKFARIFYSINSADF